MFNIDRETVKVSLDNFERYDDLTGDSILIDWQRQITGITLSQEKVSGMIRRLIENFW